MKKTVLYLIFLLAGSIASAQSGLVPRRPANPTPPEKKQERIPKDTSVQDVSIQSAVATVLGTGSGCYRAELALGLIAAPAFAGNYRLRVIPENTGKPAELQVKLEKGLNCVTVPDVLFPVLGKNNMRLELSNESGGKNIVLNDPVRIEYDPLKLTILKPGYAGTFFPGQDFSRVEGELAIRLTAEGLTARVSIYGDSIPGETLTFPSPGRTVKFSFDTAKLGFDTCTVTAELLKGDLPISKVQTEITRPPASCTKMVRLDSSGPVADGKAIFPRNIHTFKYQNKLIALESPKKEGIELKHSDLCVLATARLIKVAEDEAVKDVRPSQVVFERIRRKIAECKNKNFLFYYLCGNPERHGLSPVYLRHVYKFIREQDLFHPVIIGTGNAQEYMECADVFSFPSPVGLPEN